MQPKRSYSKNHKTLQVFFLFSHVLASMRLLVFLVGGCDFLCGLSTQAGEADRCQVLVIEGTVSFRHAGATNWSSSYAGQILNQGDSLQTATRSRATVQFSDLSVLRINESTVFGIEPPASVNKKPLLDLKSGSLYFFSREKPAQIQFRTPSASGAIRGTEFDLQASVTGETLLTLLDGEVDLVNDLGTVQLRSGEQGYVVAGKAPGVRPIINAINIIQWCLYYPAVVDVDEIAFSAKEKELLSESLNAYRSGDFLRTLAALPDNLAPSPAVTTYRAALEMSVGQVDHANVLLKGTPSTKPILALYEMIAAVQGTTWEENTPPSSASEWLAQSYYLQSKAQPEAALAEAYAATTNSPSFGFAWIRAAELEFGLRHLAKANADLAKGLKLSPRDAQAWVIQGFMSAALNQNTQARANFEEAIRVDGALANAWLGRGLCRIRQGDSEGGQKDLQVAAALEPRRSLLRSYLGKAFQNAGQEKLAEKDLRLAKTLDPNDPTPWFYSALLDTQENRVNQAVEDFGKSQALNDNQKLFRSKFLLDQDLAVRQANLALAYRDAGMDDVSRREAARAVDNDYANYSAHLFLADSYADLLDPRHENLRYLQAMDDEWLTANLLAPVGARSISKNVAERDYQPFFVEDGLGISSSTEYRSSGAWTQDAAQYGSADKMDYAIESFYQSDPGQRRNNDLEELQVSAQVKMQIDQQDSLFVRAEYFDRSAGDLAQYYSPKTYQPSLRMTEVQSDPNLTFGLHREWEPGMHTLIVVSRLHDDLQTSCAGIQPLFLYYRNHKILWVNPPVFPFDEGHENQSTGYSSEVQQIWEGHSQTLILGGKFQTASYDTASDMNATMLKIPQQFDASMQREALYAYDYWQVIDPVRITLGASYDHLDYPVEVFSPPISNQTAEKDQFSPKVGVIYTPWDDTSVRAHYTRSLGGVEAENELTVEPTMVGGINQSFYGIFPESSAGAVPASDLSTLALEMDHSFKTRTYVALELSDLKSDADNAIGVLTNKTFFRIADSPSISIQKLRYDEQTLAFSMHQLLGAEWSTGLRYSISKADLDGSFPDVPSTAGNSSALIWNQSAIMNQVSLHLNFNHSSGFFSQLQSLWTAQCNEGYTPGLENSDFWQHNFFAGYRFPKRHAEIRLGVLNLADRDYRLNPLNLMNELPRERTFVANFKFSF